MAAKGPKPIVIDSMFFKEDVTGYIGRSQKQHLYLFDIATAKLEPLGQRCAIQRRLTGLVTGRQADRLRAHARSAARTWTASWTSSSSRRAPAPQPRELVRPYAPNFQHLAWSPDGKTGRLSAGPGTEVLHVHAR